jgi:hypothetical protein
MQNKAPVEVQFRGRLITRQVQDETCLDNYLAKLSACDGY